MVAKVMSRLQQEELWNNSISQSAEILATADKVFACSDYVADTVLRYPQLLAELNDSQRLYRALEPGELEKSFSGQLDDQGAGSESDDAFMRRLRLFRHRELVRIVWRDLAGWADCQAMLGDLSAVADACIRIALQRSLGKMADRYGQPLEEDTSQAEFVVVAMGKLGGGELNFSSDIDVVFLYSAPGATDGSRPTSNEEYFRRVAQHFINLLSKKTVDGFVYRVDARLRPFGDSGPLACSVAAFEDYLVEHGRDWERYAWVKARVVNDWAGRKEFNARILRPFVYRRYLDFGVFGSLREMKSLIEREGRAAANRENIKLGPGGIREIEFIVQTLQLVRGGTVQVLRQRRLMPALEELGHEGLMTHETVDELAEAYLYLRSLENRIQSIADRQTHELPVDATDRMRMCLAMGVSNWEELLAELNQHRRIVSNNFDEILRHERNSESGVDADSSAASEPELYRLAELHFEEADVAVQKLSALKASSLFQRMDDLGRQRLERLLPSLLAACGGVSHPLRSLDGVLRVIESIGRRSAYIALLNENTAALDRLVQLCGNSDFLAQQVAAHPLLLDELLDQRVFSKVPQREDLKKDAEQRLAQAGTDDLEQRFEALRNFQQAAVFRIAVADMSGFLPLMKVSDRLTDIAEFVLAEAINMSLAELSKKYGSPYCVVDGVRRPAGFAIAGYGKLGGLELGYGSDLDIVYMHDSEGEEQVTDGDAPLDNAVFFGRVARRITHILTMNTPTGALYEVDTRLRPSGNSGLLVTSMTALDRYQRDDAWTWEHQALLRARSVAGAPQVRAAFENLRLHALVEYAKRDTLHDEVLQMRARMRAELCKSSSDGFDLKQGEGGIVDIEFLVQYLVLGNAPGNPSLIHYSDNIRQLEALQDTKILSGDDAEKLADTYRTYRERMHRLSLAGDANLVGEDEYRDLRDHVIRVWNSVFGT